MQKQNSLHVTSTDFYAGFQQATLDFELKYKPKVTSFDDIQITTIFATAAYSMKSDLWKAGYMAGFFAALYGIPYMWLFEPFGCDLYYSLTSSREVV